MHPKIASATAVVAALALGWLACSDDDEGVGPGDDVAPEIDIQVPRDGQVVNAQPPFRIQVTDQGVGVLCASVRAVINGRDFAQQFRSGCNDDTGLIQTQGQVILNDGSNRLEFGIADRAGNEASASRTFTVVAGPCLPPVCTAPPPVARVPPIAGE